MEVTQALECLFDFHLCYDEWQVLYLVEVAMHAVKCLFVLILLSHPAVAQTDFFWSFQDLNSGALNADATGEFQLGETGSLFMYFTTNGPTDVELLVGSFLDVATSASGVIEMTAAETFDFAINSNGALIGNRWLDENGGGGSVGHTGEISADGQFIDEWNAFTVTEQGIREINSGPVFLDEGYDAQADAFLFGQLDFVAIGSGSTDLITVSADSFDYEFNIVTINVAAIPEPMSTSLAATVFLVFFAKRRR